MYIRTGRTGCAQPSTTPPKNPRKQLIGEQTCGEFTLAKPACASRESAADGCSLSDLRSYAKELSRPQFADAIRAELGL